MAEIELSSYTRNNTPAESIVTCRYRHSLKQRSKVRDQTLSMINSTVSATQKPAPQTGYVYYAVH